MLSGNPTRFIGIGALCAALTWGGATAQAQFTYTLLADFSISSPLGAPFSNVDPPSVAGNQVLFHGYSNSVYGLFKGAPGSYQLVSQMGDTVPGTTATVMSYYSSFVPAALSVPVLDSTGRVSCAGYNSFGQSLLDWTGTVMNRGLDIETATPIPGGTGIFSSFGLSAVSAGTMAFAGGNSSTGDSGIYTMTGTTVAKIADKNTPIPDGTGNFTSFSGRVAIHNGTVAFMGTGASSQVGVYTSNGSTITTIADTGTTAPGAGHTFFTFAYPAISSEGVTFIGQAGPVVGIYTTIGGTLTKVVDSQETYPGSTGPYSFTGFSSLKGTLLASSGTRIAFIAKDGAGFKEALFVWQGGVITQIVESDTNWQGGYIYYVNLNPQAMDGSKLGFKVTSTAGGGYRNFLADLGSAPASGWELYE